MKRKDQSVIRFLTDYTPPVESIGDHSSSIYLQFPQSVDYTSFSQQIPQLQALSNDSENASSMYTYRGSTAMKSVLSNQGQDCPGSSVYMEKKRGSVAVKQSLQLGLLQPEVEDSMKKRLLWKDSVCLRDVENEDISTQASLVEQEVENTVLEPSTSYTASKNDTKDIDLVYNPVLDVQEGKQLKQMGKNEHTSVSKGVEDSWEDQMVVKGKDIPETDILDSDSEELDNMIRQIRQDMMKQLQLEEAEQQEVVKRDVQACQLAREQRKEQYNVVYSQASVQDQQDIDVLLDGITSLVSDNNTNNNNLNSTTNINVSNIIKQSTSVITQDSTYIDKQTRAHAQVKRQLLSKPKKKDIVSSSRDNNPSKVLLPSLKVRLPPFPSIVADMKELDLMLSKQEKRLKVHSHLLSENERYVDNLPMAQNKAVKLILEEVANKSKKESRIASTASNTILITKESGKTTTPIPKPISRPVSRPVSAVPVVSTQEHLEWEKKKQEQLLLELRRKQRLERERASLDAEIERREREKREQHAAYMTSLKQLKKK